MQALVSRGPSGSRCRLSPRCLEKPAAYLEQGPAAHDWVEDQAWTAARVATLIGRKFHVSYSVSGTTRLMPRLGFSGSSLPWQCLRAVDRQAIGLLSPRLRCRWTRLKAMADCQKRRVRSGVIYADDLKTGRTCLTLRPCCPTSN